MKVNFNRAAFAEVLGLLASVVPSRTPKPILRCVHITANDKELRLCATDLEVGINYLVSEVQIERPGEAVVSADRLTAIVRESVDEVLSLEVSKGKCEIRGVDSRFTIYSQEPEQYPTVPGFEGDAELEITLSELHAGIEQSLFATAKESSRYAINGVLWEVKGRKLILVATDGRRLARVRVSLSSTPGAEAEKRKVIVPAKTMSLLAKLGGSEKEKVVVRFVDNQVLLQCGAIVVSSNLVEGNFPKYEDIIPTDYDKKLTLSTEAALSAAKRAALLTSEESRGIKLSAGENKLVFSGSAPEAGDAEIEMAVEYKGEPIVVGFNPQFLTEVPSSISSWARQTGRALLRAGGISSMC